MWLPLQGQILRSLPLKGHIMCSRTWKSLSTSFGISLCVYRMSPRKKYRTGYNRFLRVFIVVSLSRRVISQGVNTGCPKINETHKIANKYVVYSLYFSDLITVINNNYCFKTPLGRHDLYRD